MYRTMTEMLKTWCSCLLMLAALVGGFNIDTKSAVVHRGIPGSMFGFSVALFRDGSKSGLLVGAPRMQTSQPNVTNGGAVFLCGTESTSDCRIVPFDMSGSNSKFVSNRLQFTDEKSNQWFGATVEASTDTGIVVTDFVRSLRMILRNFQPVPASWHSRSPVFVYKDLASAKHVFLRRDAVRRSLQQPYDGPFRVVSRTDKTFTVEINGKEITVSIDRIKPAYLEPASGPAAVKSMPTDSSSTGHSPPLKSMLKTPSSQPDRVRITRYGRESRPVVRFQA